MEVLCEYLKMYFFITKRHSNVITRSSAARDCGTRRTGGDTPPPTFGYYQLGDGVSCVRDAEGANLYLNCSSYSMFSVMTSSVSVFALIL